ncbi:MAG TPA: MarR family winged helix-turn-helix transcriptional regulator, partial [Mycolicibacterium fallax]|nr:MarR family winged helix-turn-helix transcriptional regulator [Mycolicibacterium fallax]
MWTIDISSAGTLAWAIAEHLHVAGPHVTAEIGKLVEAGLVEKRTDKTDNRVLMASSYPAG